MAIQREMLGSYRKAPVWRKLAEEFNHTQVDMKIQQLKKQYKDEVDKLLKSGVGIESSDKDYISVSCKCFLNCMQ